MKKIRMEKKRSRSLRVVLCLLGVCFCVGLYTGISSAGAQNLDDTQGSSNADLSEFTDGTVEAISDMLIKVNGTEYLYSMDMNFFDINDNDIEPESIHVGDIVEVRFLSPDNEATAVILETSRSAGSTPPENRQQRVESSGKGKIKFENGVYTN